VGFDPTIVGVSGAVGDIRQCADNRSAWVKYGPGAFEWTPFPSPGDQPTYRTGGIDCTVAGITILVPRHAGKSWKTTRLEIEIVEGNISGLTTAGEVRIGANSPSFDNVIATGRLSLAGRAAGEVLRYGAFDAVDVGSSDLVVNVAQAQIGGASVASVRIWGAYL